MTTQRTPKQPNLKKLEPHPLGALFPPMGDVEYQSLQNGMKENGFDPAHPIILYENQILEGNHRYTAAKATKTEPVFKDFEKLSFAGSPIDYVMQENLRRRNLTPSQLSMIGADLVDKMEMAEKLAKEESPANLQAGAKQAKKSTGEKVKKAASQVKVSPRSVATARSIAKKNPKAAKEVKRGEKSLHRAARETEEKVSAAQAKTEEYEKAVERIDKVYGQNSTSKLAEANGRLKAKHILELSNLDKDEMKRLRPFLENGFTLKDALGYKSVDFSFKHALGHARDFAISKGGSATLVIGDWRFTIERIEK